MFSMLHMLPLGIAFRASSDQEEEVEHDREVEDRRPPLGHRVVRELQHGAEEPAQQQPGEGGEGLKLQAIHPHVGTVVIGQISSALLGTGL